MRDSPNNGCEGDYIRVRLPCSLSSESLPSPSQADPKSAEKETLHFNTEKFTTTYEGWLDKEIPAKKMRLLLVIT